jgi:hypothetical protein
MKKITVSSEVADAIAARAIAPLNNDDITFNVDGTVTLDLPDEVIERLQEQNQDIELALRELLGLKSN